MKETTDTRGAQLATMAANCERLALKCEAQGRTDEASHYWALAVFFNDCIARTFERRFRGRATQRKK